MSGERPCEVCVCDIRVCVRGLNACVWCGACVDGSICKCKYGAGGQGCEMHMCERVGVCE